MSNWRTMLLGLALACGLATGCYRQVFLNEKDLQGVAAYLPPNLEKDPREAIAPVLEAGPTPPDVNHPDRPARYMTLQEAIAIGLENGTASGRQGPGQGVVDDTMANFPGGGTINSQSDNVRVLSYNPSLAQTFLEESLARFDAMWVTGMNWSTTDELQQGLQSFNNGSAASFSSSIVKALPTGGVANVSFQTDYHYLTEPPSGSFGLLNPSYTSRLTFGFEQPLLRDFGMEINQLLNRTPAVTGATMPPAAATAFNGRNSAISQGPSFTGVGTEGILVARVRMNAHKAEFERQINVLVLNIEAAYWNLYEAYGELYSNEEVLRIAHKSWMINKAKYDVGTIGPANYFPILGQYEEFRGERLKALEKVLESERSLRGIMGMPVEDGKRLVPITPPTMANFLPSYEAAVKDAMALRPELILARENLRIAQYNLVNQKNFLKPDLRFVAQYSPVGFGTRLDGVDTFIDGGGAERSTNAFRSLASDHFNDWSMGLTLAVPLGYRFEMAAVRSARLGLAQSYYFLKDQEEKAKRAVTQYYQQLAANYNLIEMTRQERKAYAESVEARFKEFAAGKTTIADYLLDAQRRLVAAQVKEYQAIAEYNKSIAKFEWSKGTILHHDNVFLSEGPLPAVAQVRAVEHEKERSEAHVLREKPRPILNPGQLVHVTGDITGDPQLVNLNEADAPKKLEPAPLPVLQNTPPSPLPEKLTPPRQQPTGLAPNPEQSSAPAPEKPLPPRQLPAAAPPAPPAAAPQGQTLSFSRQPVHRTDTVEEGASLPAAKTAIPTTPDFLPAVRTNSASPLVPPAAELPPIPQLPDSTTPDFRRQR